VFSMAAERSSPHEVPWQQRKNGSNYETGDERGAQRLLYCFSRHFTLGGWSERVISTWGVQPCRACVMAVTVVLSPCFLDRSRFVSLHELGAR
jgi:hypothetical protein